MSASQFYVASGRWAEAANDSATAGGCMVKEGLEGSRCYLKTMCVLQPSGVKSPLRCPPFNGLIRSSGVNALISTGVQQAFTTCVDLAQGMAAGRFAAAISRSSYNTGVLKAFL